LPVADEESAVTSDEAGAQFAQEILPAVRDLGMNRSGSLTFPRPLRSGECGLQIAVKPLGLDQRPRTLKFPARNSKPPTHSLSQRPAK